MELRPALQDKIGRLTDKGVTFCNPLSIDIGDDVDVDKISGDGVTVYPGCRIYGEKTVISSGAQIGREGPVTIEDCQIGPRVELKGGYFSKSVFLEQANLGLGAQVREACILEEEAGGAASQAGSREKDLFLAGLWKSRQKGVGYTETIQHLPDETVREGTQWLGQVVGNTFQLLASLVPALELSGDAAQATKN